MKGKAARRGSGDVVKRLRTEIALNRQFVDLKEAAFISLLYTYLRVERVGRRFFGMHGITDTQFNTLMALHDYRDRTLRQSELAEVLVVNRASIGAVLDRLERARWIRREADPDDRRAWFVRLTDAGHAKLKEVSGPYYRLLDGGLTDIDPGLLTALMRFNDVFRGRLALLEEQLPPPLPPGGARRPSAKRRRKIPVPE
jgi:DNA-binding MarR family transcriptional regulator